jgi:hypothetical protein
MRKAKDDLTFGELKPRLITLGFAFYGDAIAIADPEATVLDIIRLAGEEPKAFQMLLAWLDKTRDLIHVERARTLASKLKGDEWIALGVVALKQVRCGDRRFSILAELAKEKVSSDEARVSSFAKTADSFLIEKYGTDKELLEFGIRSQEIQPADPKKILTLEKILAQSPWLKFRALIGANFRADIAYAMASKQARNPYQAAKLVHCSQETAYRLWKGLLLYPKIELLAG